MAVLQAFGKLLSILCLMKTQLLFSNLHSIILLSYCLSSFVTCIKKIVQDKQILIHNFFFLLGIKNRRSKAALHFSATCLHPTQKNNCTEYISILHMLSYLTFKKYFSNLLSIFSNYISSVNRGGEKVTSGPNANRFPWE